MIETVPSASDEPLLLERPDVGLHRVLERTSHDIEGVRALVVGDASGLRHARPEVPGGGQSSSLHLFAGQGDPAECSPSHAPTYAAPAGKN